MNKVVEFILLTISFFLVMATVISFVIGVGYVAFILSSMFLNTNTARGIGFVSGLLMLFSMGFGIANVGEEE